MTKAQLKELNLIDNKIVKMNSMLASYHPLSNDYKWAWQQVTILYAKKITLVEQWKETND